MTGDARDQAAEIWTVQRVLDWSIEHLRKHGSESPRLDAQILLAHARGCQRIQLYTEYEAPLTLEERASMRDLIKRRAAHEPVAYLVGFREFFGLDFEVGPGVFIPRPDTETLVVQALEIAREMIASGTEHPRVLDVCTGSACIPVSIAANCPLAIVACIELSPTAHEFAARNIEKNNVADRVTLLSGDLFAPLPDDALFEIITSNPPYVTVGEMETLQPDVRLHEPHLALVGGADGLDVVRKLIDEGHARLVSGGAMLLEIDSAQAPVVADLFNSHSGYHDVRIARDLGGRSRVVQARTRKD